MIEQTEFGSIEETATFFMIFLTAIVGTAIGVYLLMYVARVLV